MKAGSKADLACMAYAQHAEIVRQLGLEIRRELEQCKGVLGTLHRWSHQHPHEGSEDQTHLSAYLQVANETWDRDIVQPRRQAMESCPHCKRAYQLIQDRKAFRQKLGAAKRSIIAADKALREAFGLPPAAEEVQALIDASRKHPNTNFVATVSQKRRVAQG